MSKFKYERHIDSDHDDDTPPSSPGASPNTDTAVQIQNNNNKENNNKDNGRELLQPADDMTIVRTTGTQEKPTAPTYMTWSIISIFLCCFLGVFAMIRSNEVKKYNSEGDIEAARKASKSARNFNISAILFLLLTGAILAVLFATGAFEGDPFGGND